MPLTFGSGISHDPIELEPGWKRLRGSTIARCRYLTKRLILRGTSHLVGNLVISAVSDIVAAPNSIREISNSVGNYTDNDVSNAIKQTFIASSWKTHQCCIKQCLGGGCYISHLVGSGGVLPSKDLKTPYRTWLECKQPPVQVTVVLSSVSQSLQAWAYRVPSAFQPSAKESVT